jgi:hypothetical protein
MSLLQSPDGAPTGSGQVIPTSTPVDFTTLDLLPYGVIVVDADGVILFYNRREEQISGLERDHVLGRNFFTEVAPCTAVQDFQGRFRNMMEKGVEYEEFRFVFPFAQGPRTVQISLQPFTKDGGHLCVIFVADLTEREMMLQKILQNQRFNELGSVAAMVAHNFNNLLTVIQMSAEMASRETLPPAVQTQLKRVLGAVSDGAALVSRFRAIAQSGQTQASKVVDLDGAVATAADFARQYARKMQALDGRKVELLVHGCATPLEIMGDAAEIREVVLNLVRNAIDAIPAQGAVRISTLVEGGVAVLEVLDNGTGMTPEVQEHLFTPMFTTKGEQGTGLGLASAHAAIRRHGGSISVQSAPGRGSRFRIEFPRISSD